MVRVIYYPDKISLEEILKVFWESHDPTQGDRQGPDMGTQYRSAIFYYNDNQKKIVESSAKAYQKELNDNKKAHGLDRSKITTEIGKLDVFYYAHDAHQQYLCMSKNPNGYCSLKGTGVSCPMPKRKKKR